MTHEQFVKLLNHCFDKAHEFLIIDNDNNLYNKKIHQFVIHIDNEK